MIKSLMVDVEKYDYIYILKGFAILAVIAVHFNQSFLAPNAILKIIAGFGMHGVQLFFILSSFLLWRSLSRYESGSSLGVMPFYKKKLIRLLPLYFFALVVYTIYHVIQGEGVSLLSLGLHVSLVNGLFPNYINDIMGIEWYIADLIILYVLSPYLFRIIIDLKTAITASLLSLVIAFIIQCLFLHFVHIGFVHSDYRIDLFFSMLGFFVQLPCMLLGVVFYFLFRNNNINFKKGVTIYVISSVLIIVLSLFIQELCGVAFVSNTTIWAFIFGGVMMLYRKYFSQNTVLHVVTNPLLVLGKHSYGVYLFHFVIIRIISRYFFFEKDLHVAGWLFLYIAISFMSLVIGGSLEILEKKTRKILIKG